MLIISLLLLLLLIPNLTILEGVVDALVTDACDLQIQEFVVVASHHQVVYFQILSYVVVSAHHQIVYSGYEVRFLWGICILSIIEGFVVVPIKI